MKLVIEGMDGVGKSTIAKRVAEAYHMKYVDGLLKTYFEDKGFSQAEIATIVKGIESFYDHKDSVIRTWIMGFANIFNLLNYQEDVVIDRHCLTTFFYNGDAHSLPLYKVMQQVAGKPDLIIILTATPETRIQRLKHRNMDDRDLQEEKKLTDGYDQFIRAADILKVPYRLVATDQRDEEQVFQAVCQVIDAYKQMGSDMK